jgi:hypothetical protein
VQQIPAIASQTAAGSFLLDTSNYQFVTITCPALAAATSAPTISSTSTATTGGTLLHSTTYGYKITTVTPAGETTPSAESTRATGAGTDTNTVTVNFTAAGTGKQTRVYGRTSGGPWGLLATLGPAVTSFVDDGSVTPGAAPPAGNTTAESATVKLYVPDGQTAPLARDVNGNTMSVTTTALSQTFFGGPTYQIDKSGTVTATGIYADFGGRVC